MQLFGHPLQLVILDVDGVILDLMAGFEQHLEAAARATAMPVSRRPFRPGGQRSAK